MPEAVKKTPPARRRALQWIGDHEPVGSFPCDGTAPQLWFVQKLVRMGLVETCGKEPGKGFFAFTLFRLTPAGRAALADTDHQGQGRDA